MCEIKFNNLQNNTRSYICCIFLPYFDIVVGLAWSNDPDSYAGGSLATGRASHAGQFKGDDPD